jgi:RNA polymerase sigma factor (sigma-70 family)
VRGFGVTVLGGWFVSMGVKFEPFAEEVGPRLRHALVAAYGVDVGVDAAADALAYGFERWARVSSMTNPSGYLYRVGQSSAQRLLRRPVRLPRADVARMPDVSPELVPALEKLSEQQRVVVVLVGGLQWRQSEVAELLEISVSSVRTHLQRGLTSLRSILEGAPHG